jgi:hypothetical protein
MLRFIYRPAFWEVEGTVPPAATISEVRRASLWFGLLGGAIAWAIHFLSAYVIAEFGCVGRLDLRRYGNISLVAWLELGISFIAVAAAAAATRAAHRCLQQLPSGDGDASAERPAERTLARTGLFTSGIFTFVILFESIPIFFYLHRC